MKNIHLIPTDNEQHSIIQKNDGLLLIQTPRKEYSGTKLNLNITSNEEIKGGDWYINLLDNKIWKAEPNFFNTNGIIGSKLKKIILTTDQKLIDDGVQEIEDYFLQWFVENPTCEFVHAYNDRVVGYEYDHDTIIIPQDETGIYFADNADVIITMERPKEVRYSEDEVQELLIKCVDVFGDGTLSEKETDKKVVEWFNRYKKK